MQCEAFRMKIGSLFSGIGGLELGLERAGLGETVWQVESEPFCRKVLAKHWPMIDRSIDDVRLANQTNLPPVDLICGGFPCQDLSVAGKGKGLQGDRSGLWHEFSRIVSEFTPAYVVIENVAHGRGRWLPYVRQDLEALGYRTHAFVLAASDVGAPHERRRCFVLADTLGGSVRQWSERLSGRWAKDLCRREKGVTLDDGEAWHPSGSSSWRAFPELPRMDDGFPGGVDRSEQRAREQALGNAVVPQVAEVIGRTLKHLIALVEEREEPWCGGWAYGA